MKRLLSIVLFSMSCISVMAQLSSQANSPRGGDNVERRVISLTSPGQCSDFAVWDLSDKEVGTKRYVARHAGQKANSDSLCLYDTGSRYGLELREDGVYVSSCENRNLHVTFDLPVKTLCFPMEHNDSIGGYFHGTGIYCDRRLTRCFGRWKLKADASGLIILPSGDTLRVMRVHLRKRMSNRYYPLDSIRSTLAAFNVDSIFHCQATDTAVIISDDYRWYARGYRYPVLEYRSAHMESRPEEKTHIAYLCPPESQEGLPLDDENARIREEESKDGESGYKNDIENEADDNGFKYDFSQDTVGKRVRISYTADAPVGVKAILANTTGIVYRTATSAEGVSGDMTLGYGDLRPGQYIVYIRTGEKVHSEKFNNN